MCLGFFLDASIPVLKKEERTAEDGRYTDEGHADYVKSTSFSTEHCICLLHCFADDGQRVGQ